MGPIIVNYVNPSPNRKERWTPSAGQVIQDWKKKLVAGAEHVFGAGAVEAEHAERETEQLHAKIGQLTMEKDFLSTALGRDR